MYGYGDNQSCPNTINNWKITSVIIGDWTLISDPTLKVTCLPGNQKNKIYMYVYLIIVKSHFTLYPSLLRNCNTFHYNNYNN
jgi:hypothetical protein